MLGSITRQRAESGDQNNIVIYIVYGKDKKRVGEGESKIMKNKGRKRRGLETGVGWTTHAIMGCHS